MWKKKGGYRTRPEQGVMRWFSHLQKTDKERITEKNFLSEVEVR